MTMTLETVQTQLTTLLQQLAPGEQVEITENGQPIAFITSISKLPPATAPEPTAAPRKLGTMAGTVLSMEHFDDPLEDFEEYM